MAARRCDPGKELLIIWVVLCQWRANVQRPSSARSRVIWQLQIPGTDRTPSLGLGDALFRVEEEKRWLMTRIRRSSAPRAKGNWQIEWAAPWMKQAIADQDEHRRVLATANSSPPQFRWRSFSASSAAGGDQFDGTDSPNLD